MEFKKYQKIIQNINKDLTSGTKPVYINQCDFLADLLKTRGPLNNWQTYLYHAWEITKLTSNFTLDEYF